MKDDSTITYEQRGELETIVSARAIFWTCMLEAGKETGSGLRIKNNMINTNSPIAPLYTLRKYHKRYGHSVKGPPMRPLCGSHSSLNHKLSYLLSTLLGQVWTSEDAHSVCMNTDEMLAEIETINCNQPLIGLIIGSTDVKALYLQAWTFHLS